MGDCIPFYEDGDELTCTATAAVTGKQLVKISGNRQSDGTISVAPCGAGDFAFGVAMFDAAQGTYVTIHTIASHHTLPITASATIVAGAKVTTAAAGQCASTTTAGTACVGIAVDGCASGADAMVSLDRFNA